MPTAQRSAPPNALPPFPAAGVLDPAVLELLERASQLLSHWWAAAPSGPPLPGLSVLPPVEPQTQGLGATALLADLERLMEGAFHPNHPGALAHLDPPALTASVVGDLIAAGLNNNLLAEELSPSLSRLERSLCGWLACALGLPPGAGGVPASGGSLSNLMALVVARRQAGLATCPEAVVLCSADAHVSLDKAVTVMGLPPQALVRLPVDPTGRLDPSQVELTLLELRRQGRPPMALVATAGTTVRGAVDPLEPLAAVCRRHGLWLHVDGAIGAVFALSDSHRQRVAGLGLADSLTVNPQKLLGITKTSSLLLLADPSALAATFATGLPYMEASWGGGHGGEAGLQGSRPAEILKLWLGLRQLGLEGIHGLLEGAIARRRRLQALLAPLPQLQLLGGACHLLAFRPSGASPEACSQWSADTRQQLLTAGLMLSRPLYQGHHHLKAVLGNPYTRPSDLEQLAALVGQSLSRLKPPLP